MTRFFHLGCFASLLSLACGSSDLEPFATGAGGSSSSPTGGSAPIDATGPQLLYAHDAGIRAYIETQDWEPPMVNDGLSSVIDGAATSLAQVGDDLVVVARSDFGEARLLRFIDYAIGGSPMVVDKTLSLPPVGDTAQRGGLIRGDATGGLWIKTIGDHAGGTNRNTLRWSPGGGLDGPWVVYEASPGIAHWTMLPDQETIVVHDGAGTFLLHLDRVNQEITRDPSQNGPGGYYGLEVLDDALYAVTPGCSGSVDCTGELHIWRNLEAIDLDAPTVVIQLPENASYACSLTVSRNGIAVGTCSDFSNSPEPRIHVYRDPAALVAGAQPDETLVLTEGPSDLVSYSWEDDSFQRRLSIFMTVSHYGQGTNDVVYRFEDPGGGTLQASELPTELYFGLGHDLLLVP